MLYILIFSRKYCVTEMQLMVLMKLIMELIIGIYVQGSTKWLISETSLEVKNNQL
jgi:hypothetical protein